MTTQLQESAQPWAARWTRLIQKIDRLLTPADQDELLLRLSRPERPFVLAFANAHAMNSVASSALFYQSLVDADMVLRDGSGMATLFRMLGMDPGLNLNGTDLIPLLIRRFNGRSIAVFGTSEPFLSQGVKTLREQLAPASEVTSAHGFLSAQEYLERAVRQRPALIVLGMGMPRQEEVAAALRTALQGSPCLIVCGGAIIDFLGGKTSRAPGWIRRCGMEWAFRLGQEPRRLFQRYVIGNPLFLSRALRMKLHGSH
ncbi:MAG: WecB/TagA/CpsF family glycosyltransferase [Pseudomonadota bacterium]